MLTSIDLIENILSNKNNGKRIRLQPACQKYNKKNKNIKFVFQYGEIVFIEEEQFVVG